MGVSENRGYLILGVLTVRILLFRGTILSPIFGNPHIPQLIRVLRGSVESGACAACIRLWLQESDPKNKSRGTPGFSK